MLELTDEEKKYILNEYLRNISHIASKEYQERVWIRGEGPEVDSFEDAVCDFSTDSDAILETYQDFKITNIQYQLLGNFKHAFDAFCSEYEIDNESMLNHPEWIKITEMANEILKAFDYPKLQT